ncbi:Protein of unknown function (DUF3036) [[Clostridium] sordellii]|uniref:DUF2975 domain-containing protein n=1 Tax=Paraclostridium sordellii TaxID=1505 RepID=UPI0002D73214|nr:DUF2975 domain-containing protein [Paeniclostridium sordellii]TAN65448.1 DUF2975 domain-containing protein [Paeniclostridium sordellii 8483]CEK32288.1 Protein of unknown function (DUF3036) [[Clostridium] sordellii] [Paeniclostridium sordellii]
MKGSMTSKILNIIVLLGITITCILLLGTPLILTAYLKSSYSLIDHNLVIGLTTCIYICAVPYLIALFNLKRLCSLIAKSNPFSKKIVIFLRQISICAFSEIFIFIGCVWYLKSFVDFFQNILWFGPFIAITFVSITIGLLSLVASELFKLFIDIKDENDKTI